MVKILKKLFLIDFFTSFIKPKKPHYLRFESFLSIFSFFWIFIAVVCLFGLVNNFKENGLNGGVYFLGVWSCLSIALFFFYRRTASILRSYSEEEALGLGYLSFVTPIAPVLYLTTALIVIGILLNLLMFFFLAIAVLFYVTIIILTLGFILVKDDFRFEDFISIPKEFFSLERYFFENYINAIYLVAYLVGIYVVIPFGISLLIQINHYLKKKMI